MKFNIKRNTFYFLTLTIGFAGLLWLIYILSNAGDVPTNQFKKHENRNLATTSATDSESEKSLKQIEKTASTPTPTSCTAECNSTLAMIGEGLTLNDEALRKLKSSSKEVAAYLQHDETKRQEYLELALTTDDDHTRSLLTDIFKYLPYQQKKETGDTFIASDNWRIRADGVTLITDHDAPNLDAMNTLMDHFTHEQNSYVKGNILNYIKHNSALQGDVGMLQQLDAAIYNGSNSYVRVEALKAKMKLSEQPHQILPDAVQALRSRDLKFQLAGLIVIDQVLEHENEYIEDGIYIDKTQIKNAIQSIQNSKIDTANDKNDFDRLLKKTDVVYARYFN